MMGINGRSFAMDRIDVTAKLGTVGDLGDQSRDMPMAHPFHRPWRELPDPEQERQKAERRMQSGWKDVVLVEEHAEVLVRFDNPAPPQDAVHVPLPHPRARGSRHDGPIRRRLVAKEGNLVMSAKRLLPALLIAGAVATGAAFLGNNGSSAADTEHLDHAQHTSGSASAMLTMPGQEAFGTIQEIVRILEADPTTDWSKVNIGALREHLIDMDEVTMRAVGSTAAPRQRRRDHSHRRRPHARRDQAHGSGSRP